MNIQQTEPMLESGERLLWSGGPEVRFAFNKMDILRMCVCVVDVIVVTALVYHFFLRQNREFFGYSPYAFAGVWIALSLGTVLWPLFARFRTLGRTLYAVTDRRVLVYTRKRQKIGDKTFGEIESLAKSIRSDGSGTVSFGNSRGGTSPSGSLAWESGTIPFEFANIRNAEDVYRLILNQMNRSQSAE